MNDYGGLGNQGLAAMLMQFGGRMLASGGAGERTTVGLGQALMGGVQDYYTLMDRAERQKRQNKEDKVKELQMQRMQQEIDAANKEAALRANMVGMADPAVQQSYADSLNASRGVPFASFLTQAPTMPQSMPTPQIPPTVPMQGAGLGQSMINPNWQPPAQITPQQAGQQGLAQATKEFMMQTASPELLARMNAPVKPELPDIRYEDAGGQKIPVNMTELQKWAAANPEKPLTDFILNKTESPNAPKTTINMPPGQSKFQDEVAKNLAKRVDDTALSAETAVDTLNSVYRAKELVNSGMITGKFADFKLALGKSLKEAGISAFDDPIANTETFVAETGRQVLGLVKQLGSGTGISNADLLFAKQIAGGERELDEKSIRKILDISETISKQIINKHNKNVDKFGKETPYLEKIQIPQYTPKTQTQTSTNIENLVDKYRSR